MHFLKKQGLEIAGSGTMNAFKLLEHIHGDWQKWRQAAGIAVNMTEYPFVVLIVGFP